ncbi:MAG TPA: hypothetical protein PKA27_13995 [Fimbriimonadaceae bacterium]|nr:hypothetical protein [Fimbriimonadaceae bacterium]
MPRSKPYVALLVAASLSGCKSATPELVWIDPSETTSLTASTRFEAPSIGIREQSFTVPSLPERTITLGDSSARLRRVQDLVDRNRQLAFAQIEARLLDAYLRDIDILAREKRRQLEAERRDGLGSAFEKFITLFESYARKRGPLLAELSMLADFPDSDPRSLRAVPEEFRIEQRRLDRAKTLRSEIAALDAAYRNETGSIILSAEKEHAANLREFRESIELMRLEADERATAEARRQLQGRYVLKSVLESTRNVTMPAQPGGEVRVKGDATVPVTVDLDTSAIDESRRHDILVFVKVHGYQMSDSAKEGRDATKEFEEWRIQRNLGL